MSYILEALKKAQAERALGSAPSVHATPLHPVGAPERRAGAASLWIGLAVGLVLAGAAWMVWRSSDGTAGTQTVSPGAAPSLSREPVPAQATPAQPIVKLAPMPEQPSKLAIEPEVRAAARAASAPAVMHASAPALARAPVAAPATANAAAPAIAAAPAPEENLPTARGLPEAIVRELPSVTIGGYVYSNNPADRLLLVDKVLRHEGEELAPGLILEKLLPKAAVMNYKGYRYRVAY